MPVNLGVTVVCFEKRNNCSRKLLQSETMIGAVCCVLGVVFSLATGAVMAAAGCGIEEQECILGKTSIEVAVSSCLNFIPVLVCQTAAGEDGSLFIRKHGNRKPCPVEQVCTGGMSPAHIVPIDTEGIVLII